MRKLAMVKSSVKQTTRWGDYVLLVVAAVFLYINLFVLPCTPIAGTDLDQSFYLHNATRMLDGQMIYRDFFQFTTPGSEIVYFCLFKLFGVHAWIPNATVTVLGVGLVGLCIVISRRLLSGPTVYLPAILFLVFAFQRAMDGSHHWFSMFLAMAATAVVLEKRSLQHLATAGALCAAASFFTQTRGVAVVLAIMLFLLWEHQTQPQERRPLWKSEVVLCATFIFVSIGLNTYFVLQTGLKRYVWSIIVFPLKYYPADSELNRFHLSMFKPPGWGSLPYVPEPSWFLVHLLVPLVYMLVFVACWRKARSEPEKPWDRLLLVSLVGLFLFLSIASAPTAWRMCIVALPGMIVFVWFLNRPGRIWKFARLGLWSASGAAMVMIVVAQQHGAYETLETPTGRAAFADSAAYERYKWVADHTHSGDTFLDGSGQAYFLLGLRSPARVSMLSGSDYMRPEQAQDLVESVERNRVRVIILPPDLDVATHPDDHLAPLRAYLRLHYRSVEVPENQGVVLLRTDESAP